jgi:hypothetical protein
VAIFFVAKVLYKPANNKPPKRQRLLLFRKNWSVYIKLVCSCEREKGQTLSRYVLRFINLLFSLFGWTITTLLDFFNAPAKGWFCRWSLAARAPLTSRRTLSELLQSHYYPHSPPILQSYRFLTPHSPVWLHLANYKRRITYLWFQNKSLEQIICADLASLDGPQIEVATLPDFMLAELAARLAPLPLATGSHARFRHLLTFLCTFR